MDVAGKLTEKRFMLLNYTQHSEVFGVSKCNIWFMTVLNKLSKKSNGLILRVKIKTNDICCERFGSAKHKECDPETFF